MTADKLAEISAYAGAWLRSRTPVFEPAGFPLTRRLTLLAFVKLVSSVRHLKRKCRLQPNVNVLERVVVVVVVKIQFVNSR